MKILTPKRLIKLIILIFLSLYYYSEYKLKYSTFVKNGSLKVSEQQEITKSGNLLSSAGKLRDYGFSNKSLLTLENS